MSKIDDLERMLEEAKREDAQKDSGWIKYVVYFFIFVLIVRGCSGDKNNEVQEQAPIEQSSEVIQSYDDASDNDPEPIEDASHRISTPEEKLESLTGEKIDIQADSVEEITNTAVTELDESHL